MIHTLHRPMSFDPDVLDGVLRMPKVAARVRSSPSLDPDGFDGVFRTCPVEEQPINVDEPTRELPDLETVIDEAGNVTSARVLRGHPLLNQAALDAVQRWKLTPARLNDEAIPVVMTVTVQFTLQ